MPPKVLFCTLLFSFFLISFHLLVLMPLMIADIFSIVVVALATANARISVLEDDLKASTEALSSANATRFLLRR
jgi:hypothetical protein